MKRILPLLLAVLLLLVLSACAGDGVWVEAPEIGVRLFLPHGWSWEEQSGYRPGLRLWPDDDPAADLELIRWHSDYNPSCGTGYRHGSRVTSAGETLFLQWEKGSRKVWLNLEWNGRRNFHLTGTLTHEQWERYQADLLRIADTVTFPT